MTNQNKDNFERNNRKKEGDITIERDPKTGKTFDKNDGEYVDYEELE